MSSDAAPTKEKDDLILKQLKKTQTQASIWDLLMSSKKYKEALVRALDDVKIVTDALPYEMIASLMKAPSSAITFSDEDLPPEGHNHPLFIQAIVKSKKTSCVMVDNNSTIHVCPLRLLHKFGMNFENL